MKITAIDLQRLTLPLSPPFHAAWDPEPRTRFDATLVRVHTDEGVTGIASGDTMDGFEAFVHLFIGRDPLTLSAHAETLETISVHAGRYWPLEAALWDLAGRALGVPVATLLGGARGSIPVYASLGELRPPEQRAQDAQELVQAGFRAVKVRIARERIGEGVATVAAMRDAVGGALEIMVDLNQWWRMPGDIAPGARCAGRAPRHRRSGRDRRRLGGGATGRRGPRRHADAARGTPACGSPAARWRATSIICAARWRPTRSTSSSPMSCSRWASPGRGRWPTWPCGATAGSPHTRGPTGSGCWPTCTSVAGSAAARTWSTPTTRPAGPRSGATSCSPSRVEVDGEGWLHVGDAPGLGIELDEEAVAHYAAAAAA